MKEEFREIPGYEGLYQVSNFGRVLGLKRNKILKFGHKREGYLYVNLCKNGKITNSYVHRLVLLTFLKKSDLQVNHKNGIKSDNRLDNLEYTTCKENVIHSWKIGKSTPLTRNEHGNSKLTEKEVVDIKRLRKKGLSVISISKIYRVSRITIYKLIT